MSIKSKEQAGITIKSADVELNTTPLKTENSATMLSKFISTPIEATSLEKTEAVLELHELIIGTHHFLLMLQLAFTEHKAITITPDNLWLLICQGFSEHLKLNTEKFRESIAGFDEKQKIRVRRDDFVKGKENPRQEIFPEFSKEISNRIKEDLHSKITLNFSTTNLKETTAFEIAFMDAMSGYFDYEFMSLCGIPEINILGTKEDYLKMREALLFLTNYELGWWIDKLIPIIEKMADSFDSKIDLPFWQSIFKQENKSGGPFVTGWITNFFPYIKKTIIQESNILSHDNQILKIESVKELGIEDLKVFKVIVKNPLLTGNSHYQLKFDNFPNGLSKVPFKWQYLGQELDMNLINGAIGIKEKNNTLRTEINWVVA